MINTLDHARKTIDPAPVKAVIGGLHLFAANDEHLAWTAGQLKAFGVQQLIGAHCTGIEAVYRIRELAGLTRQTAMVGAVGASYSLSGGINAVRVAEMIPESTEGKLAARGLAASKGSCRSSATAGCSTSASSARAPAAAWPPRCSPRPAPTW